jgi:hypothetical protein
MGLDATVRCTCWEEGLTTPCPFPRDRIAIDDELDDLVLMLPWDGNLDAHSRFNDWRQSCCKHDDMQLAFAHISNWAGLRRFQEALRNSGSERFATLLAEIPGTNGGQTTSTNAGRCLAELEAFASLAPFGNVTKLSDVTHGRTIYTFIEVHDGVFAWLGSDDLEMGVDPAGFFIKERAGRDLFRAAAFEQSERTDGNFVFRDPATQTSYTCGHGVGYLEDDGKTWIYPKRLEVSTVPDTPENYDSLISPLRRVFEASRATGHPVVWG